MKEAGSKKRTDKKLSRKAKAKQEAEATAEAAEKSDTSGRDKTGREVGSTAEVKGAASAFNIN